MRQTKHLLDPVPIELGSQVQERDTAVTANSIWINAIRALVRRTPGDEIVFHHPKYTIRMFHLLVDAAMRLMVSAAASKGQSQPSALVPVSEPMI
jgi:hypothetical protein